MDDMDQTALYLCENIQGAKFAYVQSDEISILLTDFEKETTDAWFDGNIQKIVSISAAMATAKFNELRRHRTKDIEEKRGDLTFKCKGSFPMAFFDSRVFTIPDPTEVENYCIARQQDATRNSLQMVCQSLFSHKELHEKNTSDMHEMLHEKGVNWNDYPAGQKRGRGVVKVWDETFGTTSWKIVKPPIFTQNREWLSNLIPSYGGKVS